MRGSAHPRATWVAMGHALSRSKAGVLVPVLILAAALCVGSLPEALMSDHVVVSAIELRATGGDSPQFAFSYLAFLASGFLAIIVAVVVSSVMVGMSLPLRRLMTEDRTTRLSVRDSFRLATKYFWRVLVANVACGLLLVVGSALGRP